MQRALSKVPLFVTLLSLLIGLGGCTMVMPGEVPEVRERFAAQSRAGASTRQIGDLSWESLMPQGKIFIASTPSGAMVEMINDDNEWVAVGATPIRDGVIIEATGKPFIFRVTKTGYLPSYIRGELSKARRKAEYSVEMIPHTR